MIHAPFMTYSSSCILAGMVLILLLHAALAFGIIAMRQRLGRSAFLVGSIGPVALLGWAIASARDVIDGTPRMESVRWVPTLELTFDFRIDPYALVFLLVIGVAGTAIFLYAARYFGSGPRSAMFAGTMTLFGGAMVGLVASDHMLATFVFWELTTITSYLLIGHNDQDPDARNAALHAAIVTGGGGLALLAGLVVLGVEAGTFRISELALATIDASAPIGLALALILAGAVTKSAQFPFHGWLPGAMAAPTPASAFLHSATMVKAGIFLVGRFAPLAVIAVAWWEPVVLAIGFVTMMVGGWQALRQVDLKLLLAYGTVSQLGFLFLFIGTGEAGLLFGGLALLMAHALFKATLFLVVGTIDHEAGTRDLRRLSGLRRSMPNLFWVAVVASISMAALPLTIGFAAKEAGFHALISSFGVPMVAIAAGASALTVAYTGRFLIGAFGPHRPGEDAVRVDTAPGGLLLWAPASLALISLALGLVPGALEPLVDSAVVSVWGVANAEKLVLWPGFVPALGWSLASITVGLLLTWRTALVDAAIAAVRRVTERVPTAGEVFNHGLVGLLRFADRSSGLLQNGSLPRYIAIILTVAIVLPSIALAGHRGPIDIPRVGGPVEIILALLICVAALTLAFTERRFGAVILLGGIGYGVAGIFAVVGGPDLSITQLLVETLALALFALVLRHLPAMFSTRKQGRAAKAVVAGSVAVFVFVAGLLASNARVDRPISDEHVALASPEAGGLNVVNVILVDFRGLDTLGEITVLVAATLGAAGLVLPVIRDRKNSSS